METTYAYFAGVIDSDGYITISRKLSGYTKKDGTKSLYYEVRVGLGQTSSIIPDAFHDVFPAYRGSYQPKNPAHKRWYLWQTYNEKSGDFLRCILPYLRLKKRQAEIALEFLQLMQTQTKGRFMAMSLSEEQIAERHRLYKEITHLNAPKNRRSHLVETP